MIARWIFAWLSWLDRQTLMRMGKVAGWLLFNVVRIRRKLVISQIRQCFPDMTQAQAMVAGEQSCQHLCTTVVEGGLMGRLAKEKAAGRPTAKPAWFTDTGYSHFENALAQGKGVIAISAHLGNWDLFAFMYALLGVKVNIVARDIENKSINKVWVGLRESSGLKQISAHRRQGSMKDMLRALRANEAVALVLDQNMSRDKGVFVDFFGRPACTLSLAAILAKRTGAPVVPAFMTRLPDGSHHATFLPAVPWEEGEDDITLNTQRYTKIIEDQVRLHPEQWFWLHRRWKTQPD